MPPSLSDNWVRRLLEAGVVGLVALFMLWVRAIPADEIFAGTIAFPGTDAYYHLRHALYTAARFPDTLAFDLFTRYPKGTTTGQYGSLFDIAAAAGGLLLGGTTEDVMTAGAWLPALLGAATAVPIYLLVKRIGGPVAGLFAAIALALSPGVFLNRSLVGSFDHHVAEAFFSTLFLWTFVRALDRAGDVEFGVPDVVDDPARLRPYLLDWGWAVLALVLYVLTWPPGILFAAIGATALGAMALRDHVTGSDARDAQWTGIAVFGGAGLALLPLVRSGGLDPAARSWIQPLFLLVAAVAVGGTVEALAWARRRELPRWALPAAVLVGAPVLVWLLAQAVPAIDRTLSRGLVWVFGVGQRESLGTIAEARGASMAFLNSQYGLLLFSGLVGLLPLAWWSLKDSERASWTVFIWAGVVIAAGVNQVRFNYYLAVVVAALNGVVMAGAVRLVDLADAMPPRADRLDVEWTQVAAVGFVLLFALPGNVLQTEGYAPAWERADRAPSPSVKRWMTSLDWVRENTPPEPFDLTTRFRQGQSMPPDAYGVLSWWDYGHWITTVARRVPVANPFQQAAPFMADWLTATSEAEAERLLDRRGGRYRYVMIDDQTAGGKWGAVAVWANVPYLEENRSFQIPGRDQPVQLPVPGSTYNASMTSRLYGDDADGLRHYRLVYESPMVSLLGSQIDVQAGQIRRVNRILDRGPADAMRDRYGSLNFDTGNRAIRQGQNMLIYDAHLESTVKVFEHVAGARLTGTAPGNATVVATVRLRSQTTGRTFNYTHATTAGPQGRFAIRVPYATTDPVPVLQGGTRYTVRATGLYDVRVQGGGQAQVVVPDQAVLDGASIPVEPS